MISPPMSSAGFLRPAEWLQLWPECLCSTCCSTPTSTSASSHTVWSAAVLWWELCPCWILPSLWLFASAWTVLSPVGKKCRSVQKGDIFFQQSTDRLLCWKKCHLFVLAFLPRIREKGWLRSLRNHGTGMQRFTSPSQALERLKDASMVQKLNCFERAF